VLTSIARTFPFIWPYRRRLLVSVVFAFAVGIFWGANLSVVYPAFEILLGEQNMDQHALSKIAELETDKAKHRQDIAELHEEMELAGSSRAQSKIESEIKDHTDKLSATETQLAWQRWLLAHVYKHLSENRFSAFAAIMGVLLFATVLKGICVFIQEYLVGGVVQLSIMSIRKRLFRNTLALDYQSLAAEGTSELTSRFTYDMDVLTNGLYLLGGKVIREPIKALVCLSGALWINWRLTVLSFIIAPLAGIVFYRFGRTLKKASHRSIESMARMYKVIGETFDSLKVVMAFNGQRAQRRRFHHENKTFFEKSMKLVKIDALTSPTTEFLGLVAVSLGLFPAVYLVLSGNESIWGIRLASGPMTLAQLAVLYSFLVGISDPARKMSSIYAKLKRASAAADRIFTFMDRRSAVVETRQPKQLPRHSVSIEFNDLNFAYHSKAEHTPPLALREINMSVMAGETIAVVGSNGSGKSTLINLLPRFFDPDHGSVMIDGIDIRDVRLADLRAQIGVVTQETLLFDETIESNIRYGCPGATDAEVEQAARQAHVMEFLAKLPDGMQTRVGEKGCRLSGGQRQRIALARAILRNPSILILDEATSAIDSHSELLIHETLEEFTTGRTTFIITHSLGQSMLNLVSRIAVMDHGQLTAMGTHEELLQDCELYRKLHHVQSQQRTALQVVGSYSEENVISLDNGATDEEGRGPVGSSGPRRTTRTPPHLQDSAHVGDHPLKGPLRKKAH
jgi:ATP-binding cassette, subfamily B, bacterial MsbA